MQITETIYIPNYILIGVGIVIVLAILLMIRHLLRPIPKKVESRIRRRNYVSQDQFLDTWKENKQDFPGCYVILIYDKKLVFHPLHYDDIYVGQSVHVRQRVFSHLKGHGNGDVYFGRKSGFKVYIVIQKCRKKKLNQAEKDLIAHFKATDSLNMTRGGAMRR